MNSIRDLVGRIGMRRVALMGGVAVFLLAALAYLATRSGGSSEMGYLYTDLDPSAAQSIVERLRTENVPFQLSADGTAVMAPQDRLAELRMSMASERLGGRIGYAILDEEEPFGVSSSRARLNETRAIEGELAQSIQSLENVTKARVHIVMPERAIFANEPRRATAAVTVKTRGRLSGESVQAIRHLVASSVPELSPESVSIVDQTGALLARAGEAGAASGGDADERQQAVEARMRQQIETMLEPIVGAGKVRAEVSATVDRDSTREEASLVDPDRQAIARQVTVESNDQNSETAAAAEGATVAEQLPEADAAPAAGGGDRRQSARNETSEDTTFDNSRTNTVRVRTPGTVTRLTVAVMVDGGQQGLPQPQIQRLQRLVENAVGFDAERGDSVVVESMPFTAEDLAATEESWLSSLPTDQLFSVLKLLIIAAVALFALRMLRPNRDRREAEPAPALAVAQEPEALAIAANPLEGEAGQAALAAANAQPSMLDQEIALAQVDGRIKLSAINRIGDAVATSPLEAVSVVRQWMAA
ncbi:flagellar basal-body MS-ring/collar protein FliF [Sphingosinicella terrae]|uniref:flagellar basal-body MS-ring/collar protein FliF n=1 Tax=Sphingosinicella terrae TaxID=2172047 RepID=UPI000E0D2678|nr:flagellar basal-body MS-ring/collar protein FliF [Sphingosinicella terrae]